MPDRRYNVFDVHHQVGDARELFGVSSE